MLRIKVLACPALFLTLDEVLKILRHRFMLVLICMVSAPPLGFFVYMGNWANVVVAIMFPAVAVSILTLLIRWKVKRFAPGEVVPVQLSLFFAGLAVVASTVLHLTDKGLVMPTQAALPGLALWTLWSFAVSEVTTWVFVTFMLPVILADIRHAEASAGVAAPAAVGSRAAPLPQARPATVPQASLAPLPSLPDDLPEPEPASAPSEAPAPLGPPQFVPTPAKRIEIARETVNFAELLYLRIERNYLDVVTTSRKMLLRSTLSEVVDQLSLEDGIVVHRSLWVARHAIDSAVEREGELYLQLQNKEVVKVARPRKKAVMEWLSEQGPMQAA